MSSQNKFYEKHVSDYQTITNLWFPKRHQRLIDTIQGAAKSNTRRRLWHRDHAEADREYAC